MNTPWEGLWATSYSAWWPKRYLEPACALSYSFSDTVIDRFAYRGLAGHSHRTRQRILAAIAGQGGVECMKVLGALRFTGQGP